MTDKLRPAWAIANQGTRLVNIETGVYLEQTDNPDKTYVHSNVQRPNEIDCVIDQPLDKIIKTMTRQGLVLKLF